VKTSGDKAPLSLQASPIQRHHFDFACDHDAYCIMAAGDGQHMALVAIGIGEACIWPEVSIAQDSVC